MSRAYVDDPPCSSRFRKSRAHISIHGPWPPQQTRKQTPYPPTPISHLPGTGRYALDSYRIFCMDTEWKDVVPSDKELTKYLVSVIHFTYEKVLSI
jgi:methyl-CpG-binding domain protein 4